MSEGYSFVRHAASPRSFRELVLALKASVLCKSLKSVAGTYYPN